MKTEDAGATRELQGVQYDKNGLQTKLPHDIELAYSSSNRAIATVNSDGVVKLSEYAKAGDSVTITLSQVRGSLRDTLDTIEFTVVDTTPEIRHVASKDGPAITEDIQSVDMNDFLDKYTDVTAIGSKGKVDVEYDFNIENGKSVIKIFEAKTKKSIYLGRVVLTKDNTIAIHQEDNGTFTILLAKRKKEEQVGNLNIAVIDRDNRFVNDTNVEVRVPAKKDDGKDKHGPAAELTEEAVDADETEEEVTE